MFCYTTGHNMQEKLGFLPTHDQIGQKVNSLAGVILSVESVTPDNVKAMLDDVLPLKNNVFAAHAEVMLIKRCLPVLNGLENKLKKAFETTYELEETIRRYDLTPEETVELQELAASTEEVQTVLPSFIESYSLEDKPKKPDVPVDKNEEFRTKFLEMKTIYFAHVAQLVVNTEPKVLARHSIAQIDSSIVNWLFADEAVKKLFEFQDPSMTNDLKIAAIRQIKRAIEGKLFDNLFNSLPEEEQNMIMYLLENAQGIYEMMGLETPKLLPGKI